MLLTILIPTYNRGVDVLYNLSLIDDIIRNNHLEEKISISISDNCSSDDTEESICKYIKTSSSKIRLYRQDVNIGLERNVLYLLEKATSEYIMFLGDDDYICESYILRILQILESDNTIKCIIPSFQAILPNKQILDGIGRDLNEKTQTYSKGFKSCLKLSNKAHQMSGLVFFRENLYEEYIKKQVNNLYPFIFFATYLTFRGNSVHLTDYPVHVTQVPQSQKDWNYGNDGLISHIFDNYQKAGVSTIQRSRLEITLLTAQPHRYMMYLNISKPAFINAIINIIISSKTSVITKLIFPSIIGSKIVKKGICSLNQIYKRLQKKCR